MVTQIQLFVLGMRPLIGAQSYFNDSPILSVELLYTGTLKNHLDGEQFGYFNRWPRKLNVISSL